MSDFKFNCPHCQQSLEAPDDMCGQQINCPSCNEAIVIPTPVHVSKPITHPPLLAKAQLQSAVPKNQLPYKISADSPAGAIDDKLLASYLPGIRFRSDEELFLFLKTTTLAMDAPGFLKPMYILMVSSVGVRTIIKNKDGNIAQDCLLFFGAEAPVSASVTKGFLTDTIEIFSSTGLRLGTYDFANRDPLFKRHFLPAIIDYFQKRNAEKDADLEEERLRDEELRKAKE